MPGKNGTGPLGQGPMTGGGFGDCVSRDDVNSQNYTRILDMGRGVHCGRGKRFEGAFRRGSVPQVDEKQYLKDKLESLEQEINSVKRKLNEMDSDKKL